MSQVMERPGGDSDSEHEDADFCDWQADDDEQEEEQTQCLFTEKLHSSPAEALNFAKDNFGFDFVAVRKERALDFAERIALINFIRSEVAAYRCIRCGEGFGDRGLLLQHMQTQAHFCLPVESKWVREDHAYAAPTVPGDPLLFSGDMDDFDSDGDDDDDEQRFGQPSAGAAAAQEAAAGGGGPAPSAAVVQRLAEENEHLRLKMLQLTSHMADLGIDAGGLLDDSRPPTRDGPGPSAAAAAASSSSGAAAGPSSGSPAAQPSGPASIMKPGQTRTQEKVDEDYFNSYSYFGIHRQMLGDRVRTDSYRDALCKNPSLIRGKTVLDVGCGTGILSMFAARAGAEKVVAVDGSSRIAQVARENIAANGYEGRIEVVEGKFEDLQSFPVEQVDVIVSEWMGYALTYESMLDTVLEARDRFLRPGGAVLPDTATIYIAGMNKRATAHSFWDEVYGFDMSTVARTLHEQALKEAPVCEVDSSCIITPPATIQHFDIMTMHKEDVNFTSPFQLQRHESGSDTSSLCYGLVLWFDVGFTARVCPDHPVVMPTSPHSQQTHWMQTVLEFKEPIAMLPPAAAAQAPATGEVGTDEQPASAVCGTVCFQKGPEGRNLDITVEYYASAADGRKGAKQVVLYSL